MVQTDDTRPARPNIVLLLTDDLGCQDLKCYDVDAPSAYDTHYLDMPSQKKATSSRRSAHSLPPSKAS